MEEYYNKVVSVRLKSSSRESRKAAVRIKCVRRRSVSSPRNKELVIQIIDEEHLSFLYNLVLGEDDFLKLKSQQGLLVDFYAFPQNFVDLVKRCREEEQCDSPKFELQFVVNQGLATLHVVEIKKYKHLMHLSLNFVPGSDVEVNEYLADRIRNLQDDKSPVLGKVMTGVIAGLVSGIGIAACIMLKLMKWK